MQIFIEKLSKVINENGYDFSDLTRLFILNNDFSIPISPKLSAVLVLIFPYNSSYHTVVIKRSNNGTVHGGQISFPGGKMEPEDKDLIQTALREAKEEIGINPEQIKVLGNLSEIYIPISQFKVTPVVGWLPAVPEIKTNPDEVENYFFIDLYQLTNQEILQTKKIIVRGKEISVYGFIFDTIFIWGATARILAELKFYLKLITE